jgi:gamma-glutamyltranspeptidase / glutathione hydrolase / leukotriene-C4 hydrolase
MESLELPYGVQIDSFSARWDPPLETDFLEDFKLYAGPLPGSGILLTFIFDVLKGYGRLDDSALTWHRVMEAFKYAYAKRTHMADPEFVEGIETLIANLTSTEYAAYIRSQIDDAQTFDDMNHYGANFTNTEDHGTAHISVIAPNGDAVSVTSTVNLL